MTKEWFMEILRKNGLLAVLVVFFIIQGNIREERINKRHDELERYCRDTLQNMIKENIEVIKENTEVLRRLK